METIKVRNQAELNVFKESGKILNLDLTGWEGGDIDLNGAKTGDIYLRGSKTGVIDLREATTKDIYLRGSTTGDIYLRGSTTGDIYLREATTKDIYLRGSTTGDIYLRGSKTGVIDLREATTKDIYLRGSTTGDIVQNYTDADKDFLRKLPLNILEMGSWQSNENWVNCKTKEDLQACGTTFCIRGYAEAEYFIENGVKCETPNALYPNLKHLFFMTKEQAIQEIKKIIK